MRQFEMKHAFSLILVSVLVLFGAGPSLNLPDIETFAKTDKEKKLLSTMRDFRSVGTILLLPPRTPKDRVEILGSRPQNPYGSRIRQRIP